MATLATPAKASTLALARLASTGEYLQYAGLSAAGGSLAGALVGYLAARQRRGAAVGALVTAGVSLGYDGARGLGNYPISGGVLLATGIVLITVAVAHP